MTSTKIEAGQQFPGMNVPRLGGGEIELGKPSAGNEWQMVVVYRGKHCPICTRYLSEINALLPELAEQKIDVVAVSADSQEKADAQISEVKPDYPVGYDLSVEQMQKLGLYISNPRSPEETDRPFSEPGLFVINDSGDVQIVDISNAPFARPDLKSLMMGMKFVRNPENNYPVRGTFQ